MKTATKKQHRKGRLRFCNETCHSGYRTDRRYGVFTLPVTFAEAGCCMYCGELVPTNREERQSNG